VRSSLSWFLGDLLTPLKVLNVFFMRALNARLPQQPPTIITNVVNPGFCISQFRRHLKGEAAEKVRKMEAESAHTTEEGSRQLVYGAVGVPEAGDEWMLKGQYINMSTVEEVSDDVLDDRGRRAQDMIWVSSALTESAKRI
jgi:retinol dehydrogenase 12